MLGHKKTYKKLMEARNFAQVSEIITKARAEF